MNFETNEGEQVAAQELKDSLGFLINGLARLMRTALEKRLEGKGLSPTTWTILMVMMEEDMLPQVSLTKRTFMDAATVTRALDILEAKGFLVRTRDERDRRMQNVELTPLGRSAALATAHIGEDVNMVALAGLTDLEKEQYMILTQRVVQQMLRFYGDGTLLGW
jgi:DNA-binding MarR family transcriptional regulator